MNHIVPFRMGEAVLPILLNRFLNWKFLEGAIVLLAIRIYDLAAMGFVVIVSGLFVEVSRQYALAVMLILGLVVVAMSITRSFRKRLMGSNSRIIEKLRPVLNKVLALNGFQSFVLLPFISVGIWISSYVFFYCVVVWIGIEIGFFKSVLASTGAVLTNLLPINGLGSIGTLEAGWSLGFVFFGVDAGSAIASAFIMHAIVILVGLAIAPLCYFYLKAKPGYSLED